MSLKEQKSFAIVGATATGKTAVAHQLASDYNFTIVSADSMQVYRGMDIGTAKATAAERNAIPYRGIDLVDPDCSYSTGAWLRAVAPAFATGAPPVIVTGGTGLYLRALLQGLDAPVGNREERQQWQELLESRGVAALRQALAQRAPAELARLSDPENPRRLIRALERATGNATNHLPPLLPPETVVIGLRLERPLLRQRIRERAAAMLRDGLLDETRQLQQRFPRWSSTACGAIGYAEAAAILNGTLTCEAALEQIVTRTCQLAKRQETWFRHQVEVTWLDITPDESVATIATRVVGLLNRLAAAQ